MCAAGVTVLSCHLGPSRPYMQTRLPILFFLPTSNMELSAVPERPVLAPENAGCDTACMRLAVGLAGGRDSLGMLQEMLQLQETEASCCRGHLGPRHAWASHIPPRDLPPLACESLQAMQQQHMQDASSLGAWPWVCPGTGWVQVRRTTSSSTARFPAPRSSIAHHQFSSVLGH